jgi:hypothetical protein
LPYKEFETRTSYKYLKEVINNLKEPICILGGWAVFFHVNKKFQETQGRSYLGSRDIDLGFNLSSKKSALPETIKILTEKLKFKPLSFRMVKEIHTETEEEVEDGRIIPAHFIFPMYIDLIVDAIPEDFKKKFGFNPIDEPLLKVVFEKNEYFIIKEFGKNLLVPKPELLLAMKVNSLPDRDKEHKKIKDICDIFALAWYSDVALEDINISKHIAKNNIQKCIASLTENDFEKASLQIGHDKQELKRIFDSLLK